MRHTVRVGAGLKPARGGWRGIPKTGRFQTCPYIPEGCAAFALSVHLMQRHPLCLSVLTAWVYPTRILT